MSAFSERLKGVVSAHGQTQGWVAARFNERTGLSFTSATIGRWINGVAEPTLEHIGALAALFGVDPGWLAFGEAAGAVVPAHDEAPRSGGTEAPSAEDAALARRAVATSDLVAEALRDEARRTAHGADSPPAARPRRRAGS